MRLRSPCWSFAGRASAHQARRLPGRSGQPRSHMSTSTSPATSRGWAPSPSPPDTSPGHNPGGCGRTYPPGGHRNVQAATVDTLRDRAVAVRRRVIQMVQALGHGYLGQGLGASDIFTTLYFHELERDPSQPVDAWLADPDRD